MNFTTTVSKLKYMLVLILMGNNVELTAYITYLSFNLVIQTHA